MRKDVAYWPNDTASVGFEPDVNKDQGEIPIPRAGEEDRTFCLNLGNYQKNPYLIREKNGQAISINKAEFRLGRNPGESDYIISDNPTVSGTHATIHTRNGCYYIVDNGSLNKTIVDGHTLTPGYQVEIMEKSSVVLSNERFVFCVDG